MIRGESVAGSSHEAPIAVPEPHREKIVVGRRRSGPRRRTGHRTVRQSRRRVIRAAIVCAGVLLLMAAGLYLGLSRQDVAPAESQLHGPLLALS
jgi:transcriptional regulator GlxA family with amidase domain